MNYREEIERIKREGKETRAVLCEQAYAGFADRRSHIFEAISALKDRHPGVEVEAVCRAIDELLALTQVFVSEAEHDPEFRTFLESKNFLVMPSLPDDIST